MPEKDQEEAGVPAASTSSSEFANALYETLAPSVTTCDENIRGVLAAQKQLEAQVVHLHAMIDLFKTTIYGAPKPKPPEGEAEGEAASNSLQEAGQETEIKEAKGGGGQEVEEVTALMQKNSVQEYVNLPEVLDGYAGKLVDARIRLKRLDQSLRRTNARLDSIRALVRRKRLAMPASGDPSTAAVPTVNSLIDIFK